MSVIGIAGCKKYIGAAKLSCLSALRSGAGIVKLFYPKQDAYFDNFPYEIIKEEITKNNIEKIMKDCQLAKSIFIGPGLGEMTPLLKIILKKVLLKIKDIPIVIDADGLTYFNMIKKKMTFNTNIILTPHKKEMMRLLNLKDHLSDSLFLPLCDDFCKHHNILLILKGAITYLFHPQHDTLAFNFADPGMATAGTGDVLTGIIASLLAQKTSLYKAAILGIYLHSKAGKLAAEIKTPYCMIASDIINYLPDIFKKINNIF